jgi:membrane protein YqaA with SNARE-associated domain
MLRRLYDWTVALAEKPYALWALALVSFLESSIFPVPPDALLAPMALARPERAFRYALVCTLASVAGGVAGYAIGSLLYDSLGLFLLDLYGYGGKIEAVKALYAEYGAWFILIKGFTPIPFKLVTIVSGFMDYPLAAFVGLALLTRGARFFLLAFLFNRYGGSLRLFIERHLTAVVVGSLMIIVLGFVLVSRLV